MKRILLALIAIAVSSARPSLAASVLLCGGAEVTENSTTIEGGKPVLHEIWHWRPEESADLPIPMMRKFITTDDCKAVSNGNEILITSSGDAVALVSHATGKTLFYANVKNAHSAEMLPGGLIVVASSSDDSGKGDRLLLFDRHHSDAPLMQLPFKAAHGVIWDSKRQVLWALGSAELVRLHLHTSGTPELILDKRAPLAPEGHDLQIAADGSALYVTNTTKAVFQVDPDQMIFKPFAPLQGISQIKGLSINPVTGQIAYTRADPGVWWTYTLRFLNPAQEIGLPTMVYKVRWF